MLNSGFQGFVLVCVWGLGFEVWQNTSDYCMSCYIFSPPDCPESFESVRKLLRVSKEFSKYPEMLSYCPETFPEWLVTFQKFMETFCSFCKVFQMVQKTSKVSFQSVRKLFKVSRNFQSVKKLSRDSWNSPECYETLQSVRKLFRGSRNIL